MIATKTTSRINPKNNTQVELELDYQVAFSKPPNELQPEPHGANDEVVLSIPSEQQMHDWICAVLEQLAYQGPVQMTIRVVDRDEITQLNETYRHKEGATNVLSFPFDAPAQVPLPLLGDVVICAPVVEQEAQQQYKTSMQHWAHMVVHGVLHLLGYDHITEAQAEQMEQLEITILSRLGYPNPYLMTEPT